MELCATLQDWPFPPDICSKTSHLELGGSVGHHHTPDVILQRLHDELQREAAFSTLHGLIWMYNRGRH